MNRSVKTDYLTHTHTHTHTHQRRKEMADHCSESYPFGEDRHRADVGTHSSEANHSLHLDHCTEWRKTSVETTHRQ